MFCNECGKEIDDNVSFCPECGAKVENVAPAANPQPAGRVCTNCGTEIPDDADFCPECGTKVKKKGKKGGVIALVAVIAAIVLAGGFMIARTVKYNNPTIVIDKLVDGYVTMDMESILDIIPDVILDRAYDSVILEGYVDNNREAKEYVLDVCREEFDEARVFWRDLSDENFSYTYDVTEVEDMGAKELADLNKELREEYGAEFKATEYKRLHVTFNIVYKGDDDYANETIDVIKVDGKWCINPEGFSFWGP